MCSYDVPIDPYISKASLMLEKFHPEKVPIYSWINKFESVADYIGVPYYKMGEFLYSMLESPENLKITKDDLTRFSFNNSYQDVISKFLTHYGLLNKIQIARDRFEHRVQYEHETIEKYAFLRGLCNQDIGISLENMPTNSLHFNEAVIKAAELQKLWQNKGLNEQQSDRQETNNTG